MACIHNCARPLLWSLAILTLWVTVSLAATDLTKQEKAKGKDVVDAVVTKLRKSNIFSDDYQFIRRLAYAETHDGENNSTFMWNNYGGIWNVPEIYLNRTKSQNMTAFHTKVTSAFNINWSQVIWRDLLKPLYSGLAARLYLAYLNLTIPQTLEGQGAFYDQYYNRKDAYNNETFINSTKENDNSTETCSGKMDLVIVLDGSSSVNENNPDNFDTCKRFVVDLIGSYSIRHVRHAFITYASEVFEIFPLDNFLTMEQLKNKTMGAEYPNAKTDTNAAILAAVEAFENAEPRNGVPKVLTIFTDGHSNPPGVENIEYAKNASIISYAIGITNEVDLSELEELAYNINSNVFALDNFEVLAEFFKRLNAETCKIPQKPTLGEPVEDSLNQGEGRFYELEFPSEGAVMVQIEIVEGETRGFYSFTEENPSSALNDGVLKPQGTLVQPPLPPNVPYWGLTDDNVTKVFITVEGVQPFNNYSITAEAAPRDDSTSTTLETTPTTTEGSSSASTEGVTCTTQKVPTTIDSDTSTTDATTSVEDDSSTTTEPTTRKVESTTNGGFRTGFTLSTSSIFMICVSSVLAWLLK